MTTVTDRQLVGTDKSIHLSEQDVKGVLNSNPEFFKVRRTDGSINQTLETTTSAELKNNQQGSSNVVTSTDQAGELSTEVYEQTKRLIVAAIHSEVEDNSITDTDIAVTATGLTIPGHTLSVGDFFFVRGLTNDNLNITYCVADITGDDIETTIAPVATEAAGASVTISSMKYENGLTPTYFTSQKRQLDLSQAGDFAYSTFRNGIIDALTVEIPESGIITATANMLAEELLDGYSAIPGQTDEAEDTSTAASTENPYSKFWIDGGDSNCQVISSTLEITNGYQSSAAAFCRKKSLGARKFAATGSLVTSSMISDSMKWERIFKDKQRFRLSAEIAFDNGNAMILDLERVFISEHTQPSGEGFSNNELTIALEENPATGTTLRVFTNF